MASVALRCFSVLVCLDAVIGYPTGPPTGACGRMAPKQTAASCHRALPQNSSAPFDVSTDVPTGGAKTGNSYTGAETSTMWLPVPTPWKSSL